ncbi:unnamed protein product, partial [Ectocarpus fasciculatus]
MTCLPWHAPVAPLPTYHTFLRRCTSWHNISKARYYQETDQTNAKGIPGISSAMPALLLLPKQPVPLSNVSCHERTEPWNVRHGQLGLIGHHGLPTDSSGLALHGSNMTVYPALPYPPLFFLAEGKTHTTRERDSITVTAGDV